MSSEPHGSPAAPERSGRIWRKLSRPAVALVAAAVVSTAATAAGASGVGVALFAAAALLAAAAHAQRERSVNLRLAAAKRTLAASELAYRRLYEGLAVGVLTFGADGRMRTANPAILTLLGFPSERDLALVDFGEHVYSAPGTFEALLRRVRVDGEIAAVDLRLRRRDGMPVMVVASVRALWDDAGGIDRYEAALLDISDLKFADRQKRSLERRFRKLYESSAVGILFGNLRRGSIDEANAKLRDLIGLRGAELPVSLDALTVQTQPLLSTAIRAALESDGHAPPLETVYEGPGGARVAALVCASVIDALQGDFVAVVLERPESPSSASHLSNGATLYRSVLEALPEAVARFNRSAQLSYCNAACREWFGFPSTPTGLALDDLLGVTGPASLRSRVERVLAGATERAEVAIVQLGGRLCQVVLTLSPHRRADGAIGGFLVTMRERSDTRSHDSSASVLTPADGTYNI